MPTSLNSWVNAVLCILLDILQYKIQEELVDLPDLFDR